MCCACFVYHVADHGGQLRTNDLSRLNRAFFTANGLVGVASLFVFTLADLVFVQGLGR